VIVAPDTWRYARTAAIWSVPFAENIGLNLEKIPHDALGAKSSAVDFGRDMFDQDLEILGGIRLEAELRVTWHRCFAHRAGILQPS